ncbi:MAG: hypothetical protein IT266_02660 [Saprospiraceae bacterium]|nr:hypothetical protein [Saprospiraceae bacterium]
MANRTITLFLICLQVAARAQSFDDFTLDKEVSVYLKKNFESLKNFQLGIKCPYEENQWYLDSLEYSPWFVGDFNSDGISDLFATGQQKKEQAHYLVMGRDELEEEGSTQVIRIFPPKERGDLVIPFIEETRQGLFIVLKQFKTTTSTITRDGKEVRLPRTYRDEYKMGLMKKDTLVYHFGHIIEHNQKPDQRAIRFVQMHSFCQFGGCPDFRMKISASGEMILHNLSNTAETAGKYTAVCDPDLLDKLFALANFLKINKSLDKFGEDSADRTVTMIIQYEDDTFKSWYDYEQGATLSLLRFYELMLQAKSAADWNAYDE